MVALCTACPRGVLGDLEPSLRVHRTPEPELSAEVRSWYLRAVVAQERGDIEEAERAYSWVLRLDGASPWAHLAVGRFHEELGRKADALMDYEQALALDADLPAANLAAGRLLVIDGRDDEAAPLLARAALPGGPPNAFLLLARLRVRQGSREEAALVLDRWLAETDPPGDLALDRARLALDLGRPESAVDDLVATLRADPSEAHPAVLLVDAARGACRVGTAWRWAVAADTAAREDPVWRQVTLELGRAAGDPDLVRRALRGDPTPSPEVLRDQIGLFERAGKFDEALEDLRALQQKRAVPDPRLQVVEGRLLEAKGANEAALLAWERVPLTGSAGYDAARHRVALLHTLARPEEAAAALEALREALTGDALLSPAERSRRLGTVLLAAGSVEEGRSELRLAIEAGDAEAHRVLAVHLEQTGETAQALTVWRSLTVRDPGDGLAWLGVARLDESSRDAAIASARSADPCDPHALLADAARQPACEAASRVSVALDAAPLSPRVLDVAAATHHSCGMEARRNDDWELVDRSMDRLRDVERAWRVRGDSEAAAEVVAARRELEAR